MAPKKIKVITIADRVDKYIPEYKKAREFFTSKLGIGIGQLSDNDLLKLRNKITPAKPGKFVAEFDGACLTFATTIGTDRMKISEVIVKNIGDVTKITALVTKLRANGL
ncbi:MAG TPA: hypothetical protein VK843_17340 [Planctomycetota bacterium]|nr:hypothetical protein [Planctomycetota bacterium]